MSLLVQEVLFEASMFNKMKLEEVPEILNNIANKYMYLNTSSRIFAKKVRENHPEVGKLGVSTHGHIVSWKKINIIASTFPLIKRSQSRHGHEEDHMGGM